MWEETLGDEFLLRPRLSRIYYRGDYFAYPLRAEDVVRRLGVVETIRCLGSYMAAKMRRAEPPQTFEDWVTGRFGRRLYDAFFREYTEKVWGIPGSEIQAEWAAQRIRNLSFWTALTSALRLKRRHVTSLIEEFHYPRLGPGQMWERLAAISEERGVDVRLNHRVTRVLHDETRRHARSRCTGRTAGRRCSRSTGSSPASRCRSSSSRSTRCRRTTIVDAARRLRYRDLLVVGLISTDPEPFPDNWIYLHDPGTRAGRVQNFGAWSPGMTRPGFTCLGVEYFCFQGDETWSLPITPSSSSRSASSAKIGLIDPAHVVGGVAIRVPRAYPMYDKGYERRGCAASRPHRLDRPAADGGPQWSPPLQQPGPLDVDGGARHAEPPRRRRQRRVGGQRGRGVPRGERAAEPDRRRRGGRDGSSV